MGKRSLHHRLRPTSKPMRLLFQEHRLPLLVAQARKIAVVGPVEELTALVRALAGEQVTLVVAVEVNPEGLAGGGVALQQLLFDVGLAGRCHQRRPPSPRPRRMSLISMRGGTRPGQRIMAGTR